MHLIPPDALPQEISAGIGFRLSVEPGVDSVLLDLELAENAETKIAAVFAFRSENGTLVEANPEGLSVSKKFGLPFFYIKMSAPPARSVPVPQGTREIELHLLNWTETPFRMLRARAFANLDRDDLVEADKPQRLVQEEILEAAPDFTVADRITQTGIVERLVRLEPGCHYEHQLSLFAPDTGNIENRSAALLPRFYDEHLRPVTAHDNKFANSERLGEYCYLPSSRIGTSKTVEIDFPETARWYGYRIAPWLRKELIVTGDVIERVGISRVDQANKIWRELDALGGVAPEDVRLIYTGTTRIGERNRANRSMMMATELAASGKAVIFVYYRSRHEHSILEDQRILREGGGRLVQIPNDLFLEFADKIVRLGRYGGLALLSIPDAGSMPLINHLSANGWRCAYEARDDWEEFQRVGAGRWYDINFERYLARKADFTLSVSPPLREKLIAMGARVERSHILANGAGARFHAHFNYHNGAPARGTGRKIGYFGHLTQQWFDWPALIGLARQEPGQEFEIIGHGDHPSIDLPNIRFLGPLDHEQIIEIAQEWEIGLIPFVPSRLANAVDPIKVYEYLCLGLKVVSVYMEQIVSYPNVYLYVHSNELAGTIAEAREAAFDDARNAQFCQACSWADRVRELEGWFVGSAE